MGETLSLIAAVKGAARDLRYDCRKLPNRGL
jgi:hypothetical protein